MIHINNDIVKTADIKKPDVQTPEMVSKSDIANFLEMLRTVVELKPETGFDNSRMDELADNLENAINFDGKENVNRDLSNPEGQFRPTTLKEELAEGRSAFALYFERLKEQGGVIIMT